MGRLIDLTNKRFNHLFVLNRNGSSPSGEPIWLCRCDCGEEILVRSGILRSKQKSCRDCFNKRNRTHGLSETKEYNTWQSLRARCLRKTETSYKHYGGRGIKVCDRWLDSFDNFFEDMGKRPSIKHSIDRIDVNKGYSKENCRWATSKEQAQNKRKTRMATINGVKKCITEWCRIYNINHTTVFERIKRGWSVKVALATPLVKENDYSEINIDGKQKPLWEWAKKYRIRYDVVKQRVGRGWTFEQAIKTPLVAHGHTIKNFKKA